MSTSFAGAIVGFAALGLLYAPQLATISATFPAMFPTPVRFAGFAIAYNISTSLFGGTAPAVNSWLLGRSEERRVGKECVSTCRYRGSPYPYKKKTKDRNKRQKHFDKKK